MATTKVQSELIVDDVALAGNPTTTTQAAGNATTRIATTAFIDTAISNLIDSAPGTLNTLNEIAAALNDDPSFTTTVNNAIATKLPLAGGTLTGDLTLSGADIVKSGSADLIIDVGGRINLSADDNGEVRLYDGSSLYAQFKDDDDRFRIEGLLANKDMMFVLNDGGTPTTALKLDAASGGDALFYGDVQAPGIYVGSTNTSYDLYNNGTSYFNGAVTVDDVLTVNGGLNVNGAHINIDAGMSFQWGDSHERIEQSDGHLEFFVNNGEAMTLDTNGLGLGTTDAAAPLHIKETGSTSAVHEFIRVENHALGGTGAGSSINFHHYHAGGGPSGGAKVASITAQNMASWPAGTPSSYSSGLTFGTLHENTFEERMRITSDGNATFAGEVKLADDKKITLGASDDIQFKHHNSGYGHLENTGTLYIDAEVLSFRTDNSGITERLNISAAGAAAFSGTVSFASHVSMLSGSMTLNSTSDGNQAFAYKRADGTLVGQIYPYNNRYNIQTYNNQGIRLLSHGTGQIELEGNVVINEDSGDRDFRIESNSNSHMLFVDGTNNDLLIGNSTVTPASGHSDQAGFGYQQEGEVQIANTSNATTLTIGKNQGTDGSFIDFRKQSNPVGTISVLGANNLTISGTVASHAGISFATNSVLPVTAGAINDATTDLGQNGNRFKDIWLSGGVNFSGNSNAGGMSSETFDDYEEGTWTPTVGGWNNSTVKSTASQNQGHYTKVGNLVTVTANIVWNGTETLSGGIIVRGLPYATKNVAGYRAGGSIAGFSGLTASGSYTYFTLGIDASKTYFYIINANASGYGHSPTVSNSGAVYGLTFSYQTT